MTASTATSTLQAPPAPAAAPPQRPLAAVPAPRPAPAAAHPAPPQRPRTVRATVHAGGLAMELILGQGEEPASALDVDPRLLIVHRPSAAPAEPARRALAPPSDLRREQRERRRRLLLTSAAGFAGAVAAGLSVATALA